MVMGQNSGRRMKKIGLLCNFEMRKLHLRTLVFVIDRKSVTQKVYFRHHFSFETSGESNLT